MRRPMSASRATQSRKGDCLCNSNERLPNYGTSSRRSFRTALAPLWKVISNPSAKTERLKCAMGVYRYLCGEKVNLQNFQTPKLPRSRLDRLRKSPSWRGILSSLHRTCMSEKLRDQFNFQTRPKRNLRHPERAAYVQSAISKYFSEKFRSSIGKLPVRKKGTKAATGGVSSGSVMLRAPSFSYTDTDVSFSYMTVS